MRTTVVSEIHYKLGHEFALLLCGDVGLLSVTGYYGTQALNQDQPPLREIA